MKPENKKQSNSNETTATSVSPLDTQAFPKNDIVSNSNECGFIPLYSESEIETINKALKIIEDKVMMKSDLFFTSPDKTKDYITLNVANYEREVFGVLFMDNQHRMIANEIMFYGTIDSASVYPREIVKRALQLNAAAIIIYHNHPSGMAEPSQADRRITRRITDALSLVDIRVLDHFVIGGIDSVSFAQRGWL